MSEKGKHLQEIVAVMLSFFACSAVKRQRAFNVTEKIPVNQKLQSKNSCGFRFVKKQKVIMTEKIKKIHLK